jgi:hypothetical protein
MAAGRVPFTATERESPPSCEPERARRLTPAHESRSVFHGSFPERTAGALVVRRLAASLMLLACLLGIVQPALACASPSDCCSSGCSGQMPTGSGLLVSEDCCAIQGAVGASVSLAPQSRQPLDVAGGSPALTTLAARLQPLPSRALPAPRPGAAPASDQSLTYLRTARLRL